MRSMHRSRHLSLELMEPRHLLTTFVVDTLMDQSDGDFSLGEFSLREAIELANVNAGADAIAFAPTLHGGTITLNSTALENSGFVVTDELQILGPGASLLTIDASGVDPTPFEANRDGIRAIDFRAGPSVISDLTITGGDTLDSGGGIRSNTTLLVRDVTIRGNASGWDGGGASVSGETTIEGSLFEQNFAHRQGGGIANELGNLVVINSEIAANEARLGGGLFDFGGETEVIESRVTGNLADFAGGGIGNNAKVVYTSYYDPYTGYSYYGYNLYTSQVSVVKSTVSENQADYGGGLSDGLGAGMQVDSSTISGNVATDDGGGMFINRDVLYPYYYGNDVSVVNSTFSSNVAGGVGGGIAALGFDSSSNAMISHTTITKNVSWGDAGGGFAQIGGAFVNMWDSIIAENENALAPDILPTSIGLTYNLIGDAKGSGLTEARTGDANGNLIGGPKTGAIDPRLGPLLDNAGPTRTHRQFPDSPVIDAGFSTIFAVPTEDQRGFLRVSQAEIDMGSVELAIDDTPQFDFNWDGLADCQDIDLLVDGVVNQPIGSFYYDVNYDGQLDLADVHYWLEHAGNRYTGAPFLNGDMDFDGFVDGSDYLIWNVNKFTSSTSWCSGDLNASGFIDGQDFIIWNAFKFQAADQAVNVPVHNESAMRDARQTVPDLSAAAAAQRVEIPATANWQRATSVLGINRATDAGSLAKSEQAEHDQLFASLEVEQGERLEQGRIWVAETPLAGSVTLPPV